VACVVTHVVRLEGVRELRQCVNSA
jgi:hypothetical protein